MKRPLNTAIDCCSKSAKNGEHYTLLSVIEDEVRRNVCRWERVQTVTNSCGGTVRAFAYGYDALDRPTSREELRIEN